MLQHETIGLMRNESIDIAGFPSGEAKRFFNHRWNAPERKCENFRSIHVCIERSSDDAVFPWLTFEAFSRDTVAMAGAGLNEKILAGSVGAEDEVQWLRVRIGFQCGCGCSIAEQEQHGAVMR